MTYHSSDILKLKNCSLTIKTLGGIEHFENIHKTARICHDDKGIIERILKGYAKGKKGGVGQKRR